MEGSKYDIKIAEHKDLEAVLNIMRNNFHYEETMAKVLYSERGLTESELEVVGRFLDKSIEAAFKSSHCIVTVDNVSNKIVGAAVTILSKNPRFGEGSNGLDAIFPADESTPKVIEEYWEYLEDMDKQADLFGRYPNAEIIMEVYAVAVDQAHRKKGLAREMIARSFELAKEQKIPIVFGVFTSKYSTKSAEKAGMKNVMEIDLLSYRDKNDKCIFAKSVPHNIASIMIYEMI